MWQEHWTWIGRVWRTAIVLPIWSTSFTPPELKKAYKRLFNIHSTQIILVHLPRFTGLPTLPTLPHDPNMTQTWPKHDPLKWNIPYRRMQILLAPWSCHLSLEVIIDSRFDLVRQRVAETADSTATAGVTWPWNSLVVTFLELFEFVGLQDDFRKTWMQSVVLSIYIYSSKGESIIVKVNMVKHDMMVLWRDFLCGLWLKAPLHRGAKSRLKRTNASSLAGEPGDCSKLQISMGVGVDLD